MHLATMLGELRKVKVEFWNGWKIIIPYSMFWIEAEKASHQTKHSWTQKWARLCNPSVPSHWLRMKSAGLLRRFRDSSIQTHLTRPSWTLWFSRLLRHQFNNNYNLGWWHFHCVVLYKVQYKLKSLCPVVSTLHQINVSLSILLTCSN